MKLTTKIIADVDPSVKEKLFEMKQAGETNKDVLVRVIEEAYNRFKK